MEILRLANAPRAREATIALIPDSLLCLDLAAKVTTVVLEPRSKLP